MTLAAAPTGRERPDRVADPVVRFARLFRGRDDVQGVEHGGCLHRRLTLGHYRGHLQGQLGLGIYPLLQSGRCRWAAIDVDNGDLDATLLARRLLAELGLPAVVFTSRQKGYHVVVFFGEWVNAAIVRRVLKFYAAEAGLPSGVEIYPRADRASGDSIAAGCYLRLPYLGAIASGRARHLAQPGRRVALHPEDPARTLTLAEFLDVAEAGLVRGEALLRADELLKAGRGDHGCGEASVATPRGPADLPVDPAALGISPTMVDLIVHGWRPGGRYPSRSEVQQAVTNALVAAGHDDETIWRVLTDPQWGISERVRERSTRQRRDVVRRCIAAARRRVVTVPGTAAGSLTPSLHRQLVAHKVPPLAWPVLAEILSTVDRATGLSLATARSIARRLGYALSTVYRRGLGPLMVAGLVEEVPLERCRGRWSRVAFRVGTPSRADVLLEATPRSEPRRDVRASREGVAPARHGAEDPDFNGGPKSTMSHPRDAVIGSRP